MPFANFSDTQSIAALYQNCLEQDKDLTVLEFIGEKVLFSAFPDDDEQDVLPKQKSTQQIVHIQTGVLYQQKQQQISFVVHPVIAAKQPLINTAIIVNNFSEGVFHPPSIS
jgi:hypothetical protein